MIKVDESLREVWEWKDKAQADFEKSGYTDIVEFIRDDVKEFIKKNNIQYFSKIKK